MPSQYAPKHFLRQVHPGLLQRYFSARSALGNLDWASMEEGDTDVEAVFAAWHALPEQTAQEIEQEFRDVHDLASAEGMRTILEEGQYHSTDLTAELDAHSGFIDKVMHVFLNHRRIFNVACYFDHADALSGRSWHKRKEMPRKKPDVSQGVLDQFGEAIKSYFQETQGRGEHCHVDTYFRGRRRNYFFAYPQDYADTYVGYDGDGTFRRRPHNPAFEIVFVYDENEGTLDLFVQGDKKVRQDLQKLFSRIILHEELGEENAASAPYQLNVLKQRGFAFPTDPADGITDVRVKEMSLSLIGNSRRRITLDVGPKGSREDIHEWIETALHEQRLPMSNVDVKSAVLQLRFANTTGRGRAEKTVTFRVSAPDACSLKDKPEHLKARKCLRQWEIERV